MLCVASLIGGLALQPAARAIPIGDFSWNEHTDDECVAGLCGAFFSIGNFSDASFPPLGASFFDVFVDLDTGSSLSLGGEIAAGTSSQSTDDLFGLSIFSAVARLTFAVPTQSGLIQFLDLDGNAVFGLTAPGALLIDYRIDDAVPVSEPSPLLLFVAGLIGVGLVRKARQHVPATSRMNRTHHVSPT